MPDANKTLKAPKRYKVYCKVQNQLYQVEVFAYNWKEAEKAASHLIADRDFDGNPVTLTNVETARIIR